MNEVAAIIEFAEERDRKECVALAVKTDFSRREWAQWAIDHKDYSNATLGKWTGWSESTVLYLRRWAAGGFIGGPFDRTNQPRPQAPEDGPLITADNFQDDGPAADRDDPDSPGVDAHTLKNILDSISQSKAVAEAWRKIVKASSFDREAKAEIYNAINKLLVKWRTVQSTLERKGKSNDQS